MMKVLRAIHAKLGLKYRFDRSRHYARRFGMREALATYRRIWARGGKLETVNVPGIAHPVVVRAGTADAATFEKMFIWGEYDLEYPPNVRTIIDAGANIGLSAIVFATTFPDARIIAIEPERRNFELLQRNTASYPNVTCLHAALWGSNAMLGITDPNEGVDRYRFSPDTAAEAVQAFSVGAILDRFGADVVDVLKIDIEGGETAVFAEPEAWIGRVRMFVVELHGAEASQAFFAATGKLRGRHYHRGESDVVVVAQ